MQLGQELGTQNPAYSMWHSFQAFSKAMGMTMRS